ncbi:hypothetical protein CXF86_17445 [Shewanella sp. GutCb]|uniref:hypothetical protein n=1 Tax=Shewanella sp. GutCb TaxID=2058315 RepID=UPI000C7AC10C|nr:hypothetical protein [Shewanella sp. GutCb]PKG73494.1 hypothetical protein CXF86_17445 [Shewanella sp. GutCb]
MDILSTGVGFLIGTATGACGNYFAAKYTDNRKLKEHRVNQNEVFKSLCIDHPTLLKEMKTDLEDPKEVFQRDFSVASKKYSYGGFHEGYIYYEEEHNELINILKLMSSKNCIVRLSSAGGSGTAPRYRFSEWFSEQLLNWKAT